MESNYLLELIQMSFKDPKYSVMTKKEATLLGTIKLNSRGKYVFVSVPAICLNKDELFGIVGFLNNLNEEKLKAEYDNKTNAKVG